jgi:putative membrane protein
MSDPRVFFAAERTLLAWIRTGLTVMGFGFVVARFGLFLRLVVAQHTEVGTHLSSPTHFSNYVGIALVLLGVGSMLVAAFQHRAFVSSLPIGDIPSSHGRHFPVVVAFGLSALGLLLAAYLAT